MELILSLGSNLGQRQAMLAEALQRLETGGIICTRKISSIYETKAVDYTQQPDFLNLVALCETTAPPLVCLHEALAVETKMGRRRTIPKGPRTIDIDLLDMAGYQQSTSELTLPHPRMLQRAFILVPLAELLPERHWQGLTARDWLKNLDCTGVKRTAITLPIKPDDT